MIITTVTGMYAAMVANRRFIQGMRPGGAVGKAHRKLGLRLHRYAVKNTPVWTSAWQASHRITYNTEGMEGRIFVSPLTRNPTTGKQPSVYASEIEARGYSPKGKEAPYRKTIREELPLALIEYNQEISKLVAK